MQALKNKTKITIATNNQIKEKNKQNKIKIK